MEKESAIIKLPEELNEVVTKSSLQDLTKAQSIAMNYAPLMESVNEQMNLLNGIEKGNVEHLPLLKRIRLDLGKICGLATDQKKSDKDVLLLETRFIDGLFNTVNGAARLTQSEAKEKENHFEKIEEAKREKLRSQRQLLLDKFNVVTGTGDLAMMDESVWSHYIKGVEIDYNNRIEAEKKAEAERIAKEKAEAEERKRIAEENAELKKQAEEREKADKIRIAKEEKKAEADRMEREKAEAAHEAELKKQAEENARLEDELKAKKQAEEKAEQERLEAEKLKADEARKLALAPEKDKLKRWVTSMSIEEITSPEMSKETIVVVSDIVSKFDSFKIWAENEIKKIK